MAAAHAICCIRAMGGGSRITPPKNCSAPLIREVVSAASATMLPLAGPFGGDVLHPLLAPGGEPCRQDQAQVATAEGRWATRASAVRRPGGFPVCKGCGGGSVTLRCCSGQAGLGASTACLPAGGLRAGQNWLREA